MNLNVSTKLFLLFTLVLVLLSGCTSFGGTPFQPTELSSDKALIYVYRPRVVVGGAVSYPIYINNRKVTTLPHTGYYAYLVEPGEVFISAKTLENDAHVKLDAKAGQIYYIKGGTATGQLSGRATLNQVHPDLGAEEIKECAYYQIADELKK
jgi:hypothetical protein